MKRLGKNDILTVKNKNYFKNEKIRDRICYDLKRNVLTYFL